MKLVWTKTNDYLSASTTNFEFKNKLAMFDLDKTLITPKIGSRGSGKGFPINSDDWKFNFDNVKETLSDYFLNNYSIIIISNQCGISSGKQTFEQWSNTINQMCKELNIELYVFCSIDYNKYRKPNPAWFNEFIPENIKNNINRHVSFYCGDACGRNGDFSDTDYKFALNCMIKFKTPENFFTGEIHKIPIIPIINYPNILQIIQSNKSNKSNEFKFTVCEKEMILMVGYQGSGKSFVANKIKTKYGYDVINQDTLKTSNKSTLVAKKLMKENKSIIIDQTNPDKETRKKWIDLANEYNYKVRLILMTTSKELSKHNNCFRHIVFNVKRVPDIAYNIYTSKFVKPSISEGIDEIIEMHCLQYGGPTNYNYYLYLY